MPKRLVLALATVAACGAVQASVVFSDNFDTNGAGLNVAPAGWTPSNGTVDTIGVGFFDLVPGNGLYIDMDGSIGDAGKISRQLTLVAGHTYALSFDLAGNQRNDGQDAVIVTFGPASSTYSLARTAGFTSFTQVFTPSSSGPYTLSFEGIGNDNVGMLLDNVSVTTVPEPQTPALLALGLAAFGAAALRRRA